MAGGAEKYIHEIAKRLRKNHEITLFCGEYPGCEKETIIDDIRIIRKGGKYSLYLYAPLLYLTKLRGKYDIIIDCENGIPFFTPLFTNKKIICVMHHVHTEIFSIEMKNFAWLGRFLEGYFMPLVYKNIDFITVSPSTKKDMMKLGIDKNRIHLVFNGINGVFFPNWKKKKDNIITYIGRDKKYKQLDHLVKAFSIVKKEIKYAKLIIAGRGEFTEIKKESERLNLDIEVYGEIEENKKIELLQQTTVFVNPSMKEGWGLTIIEANRCGVPTIAYNVPGLRDSIINHKTGILIGYEDNKKDNKENTNLNIEDKEGNIEEIANTIIKFLKDKEFCEELSKNAYEWSKNFDWNKSAEDFENFIENKS